MASRYVHALTCPDPDIDEDAFVAFCRDLASSLRLKGILPVFFPTNDKWLRPLSRAADGLSELAALPFPAWEVLQHIMDKALFARAIEEIDIPAPKSRFLPGREMGDVGLMGGMAYPLIIKPADWNPDFFSRFKRKTLVVETDFDMRDVITSLNRLYPDVRFIVQEYIPGGAETLFTVTSYSDVRGTVRGISVGHKVLQEPREAGTIVSGVTRHVPRLEEYVAKLSPALGMYGIANTEFKFDARDGQFKVIEVNMRPGKWIYSATAAGVNLPLMCIEDILGRLDSARSISRSVKEIYWHTMLEELVWRLKYRSRLPNTPPQFRSLPKVESVFMWKDPGPFLFQFGWYLKRLPKAFRLRRARHAGSAVMEVD